ncbi:MAG TPA: four helix bundle protein [Vicinamibacterales bacterium]|nr:four helix bundle protein [Vicinamibacterales bacterium]
MTEIRNYKDLDAWRIGMETIDVTYRLTSGFPAGERFGLVSQMRRAAVSIPSNVAEGQAVRAPRWSLRHIVIAIGSTAELDTQLEAAVRLGFVDESGSLPLRQVLERLQQLLYGLRRAKERRIAVTVSSAGVVILAALFRFFS